MNTIVSISLDLVLFIRCLIAISWSIAWTIFIQKVAWGRRLAEERAWIAYGIGCLGVFMATIGGDWFTCFLAFCLALVPIAIRGIHNEISPRKRNEIHHTNMLRTIETVNKRLNEIVEEITALSDSSGVNPNGNARIIHILNAIHDTRAILARARNGGGIEQRKKI